MRLSILIAEDSPVDRMLLSTIVGKQGHRVLTAADGQEAVALFQQERPQLVLMDALMPVMDGFEATRQIRSLERSRQIAPVPVIALTAHILEEHRQHGLDAGMDDFLGKPLDSGLLYRTLERYLKPAEP